MFSNYMQDLHLLDHKLTTRRLLEIINAESHDPNNLSASLELEVCCIYISQIMQQFFTTVLFESREPVSCSFHCRLHSWSFLRCFWAVWKSHVRLLKPWKRTIQCPALTLWPAGGSLRWRPVRKWCRQTALPSRSDLLSVSTSINLLKLLNVQVN